MKVKYEPLEDELVLDYYVPISIDFPENIHPRNSMLHYYRFINKCESHIELGIDVDSQKIISIVIISINDIKMRMFEFDGNVNIVNPNFNLEVFNNNQIVATNESDFEMCLGAGELFFLLKDRQVATIIHLSKHVQLLLDHDDDIVGLRFINFNNEEWRTFISHLKEAGRLQEKGG